jgi:1-acyl-sn-glycerol-3-phosphate acyltransferase
MDFWYSLGKMIVGAYVSCFVPSIHVEGRENLPPGPKIIVANHPNATDAFVVPFIVPEKVHFLIQADILTVPLFGRLLALADQIPVVAGRGREALDAARDRLVEGHAVAIFPEGRLNHGNDLRRAGAGAALLALESGAPVVPLGFYVPPESAPIFRKRFHGRIAVGRWQLGGRCFVCVGKPWQPSSIVAQVDNRYRVLRDMTKQMMARIADLVRQAKEDAQQV